MSTTISASMVKDLREKTGAGMMECKKALEQSSGDFEGAVKVLRESGAAKAAKREGRTAAEGLVEIALNDAHTAAAIAELNSETDFVARNDEFQSLAKALAATALAEKTADAESLSGRKLPKYGKTAGEAVGELLAKIGEKITLSRAGYLEADLIAGYIHPPGKIGVLLAAKLNGITDKAKFAETLREVAMHVAAVGPRFITDSEVDQKTLEAERDIFANIARKEGKPEQIIPKIVDGKIKSFYKDNCLLFQEFVKDNKQTIKQVIDTAAKQAGGTATLVKFIRYRVGETSAQ